MIHKVHAYSWRHKKDRNNFRREKGMILDNRIHVQHCAQVILATLRMRAGLFCIWNLLLCEIFIKKRVRTSMGISLYSTRLNLHLFGKRRAQCMQKLYWSEKMKLLRWSEQWSHHNDSLFSIIEKIEHMIWRYNNHGHSINKAHCTFFLL